MVAWGLELKFQLQMWKNIILERKKCGLFFYSHPVVCSWKTYMALTTRKQGRKKINYSKVYFSWLVWHIRWMKVKAQRASLEAQSHTVTHKPTVFGATAWWAAIPYCSALNDKKMSSRDLSSLPCQLVDQENLIVWNRHEAKTWNSDRLLLFLALTKQSLRLQ